MRNKKLKRIAKLAAFTLFAALLFSSINIMAATNVKVEKVSFTDATVNATALNLRQGPSTSMPVVATLKKNQDLKVLGKTGEWYFVFDTNSGKVGAVHGNYITPVNSTTINDPKLPNENVPSQPGTVTPPSGISNDEKTILNLVNNARKNAGAGELEFDLNLAKVARDKAKDMVENNYFSHNSKIYGSPFDMMRSYGISYKAAGENIAGNQTMERAFQAWMNSPGHKQNILNGNYNATGIGVYTSPVYGKIIVQMFIRK